jgi:uncharacterized protein (TIGR02147 family)
MVDTSRGIYHMITVFDYVDYRALLKDLYEERKKMQPIFSYRYIGQRVGFKSAGFFTNIIQGKRNISHDIIFKFAELFKFSKRETEYFETLVQYDQAKVHSQRKFYYEKILSMAKSKVKELAADQYEYFDKWYYVAVRELLNFYPFKGDYQALGKMLRPSITPSEAKRSVDLLQRIGLVVRDSDGSYSLTDKTITTVPQLPLVAAHNFQQATLDMAKQAIDRFSKHERSISTLTLSLSGPTYDLIEEKLATFRREVLELVKGDQNKIDRVYQFNFQIYPLTGILSEPIDNK